MLPYKERGPGNVKGVGTHNSIFDMGALEILHFTQEATSIKNKLGTFDYAYLI